MVKFQNNDSNALDTLRPIPGLFSCAVISTFFNIRCYYFFNSSMVISGALDIRGHIHVRVYSEYHHAINGYY